MAVLTTSRNGKRSPRLFEFTHGVDVDRHLGDQEIRVQRAWARELARLGVLSAAEIASIDKALVEAGELIATDKFDWRIEDEDIHMNLERFVNDRTAGLGKKMHLGRSRNDLIATTLRLHVADTLAEAESALASLVRALCDRAEADIDVLIPGMTHLQNGQPLRFSHVLASHATALVRDLARIRASRACAIEHMPLGSAALAGTTLPVDLSRLAQTLGFSAPPANSYDAVGDRDFVLDALQSLACLGVHLSRYGEDIFYWASTPVGLLVLPPAWSTGSSIMPNKRNPDVAELARAKGAHWIGAANEAAVLLKGLATSYDSDLHEIKGIYLRTVNEAITCLEVLTSFTREMQPSADRARELLAQGHVLATEIADHLAQQGLPFRDAYRQVAALVELAESHGCQIDQLAAAEIHSVAPEVKAGFLQELSAESSVERRNNEGGTARHRVLAQLTSLRKQAVPAGNPSSAPR